MKTEGGRRKERRTPERGWSRVTLVIVLLAAVLAFVAWNVERGAQKTSPVAAGDVNPQEQSRKPVPSKAADPRDTSRERPGRERTSR
jgi:hypothetical protein